MARFIIPILALVGLGAGAAAGVLLKPPAAAPMAGADSAAPVARPDTPSAFLDMASHFIVPLIGPQRTRGLMVLSLTIEVEEADLPRLRSVEPRLRDAFLRVFFDHANAGGFDGNFTSASQMDALRTALRETARAMVPAVRDVLIVDMVRQET